MTTSAASHDLQSFAAEMEASDDAAGLRTRIATAIQRRSECDALSFFEPPDPAADYVRTLDLGRPAPTDTGAFAASGPFARWLRVNDELLVFADRPSVWNYLPLVERNHLLALGADACLPLVADNELVAFVALCHGGQTQHLDPLQPMLEAFARQAAGRWQEVSRDDRSRARRNALHRLQQLGTVGEVAASIAHEVRNPLTSIRSSVQSARDLSLPADERASVLGNVLQEVDRLDRTLTGMLHISQPASSARGAVDIDALVRSATAFVRAYARGQGVTLESTPTGETLPVLGDGRELRQVVTNLLLNACQACKKGDRVTASVRRAPDESPFAEIEVKDSGHGIPREHLAKVFDSFFTTRPQGTGLGLSFCRDVVRRHGGTISIDSVVDAGTSVFVRLPILETHGIDSGG